MTDEEKIEHALGDLTGLIRGIDVRLLLGRGNVAGVMRRMGLPLQKPRTGRYRLYVKNGPVMRLMILNPVTHKFEPKED